MRRSSYEANITRAAVYHRVGFRPGEHRVQDSGPSTVCIPVIMVVLPFVVKHLYKPVRSGFQYFRVSKRISHCLKYLEHFYTIGHSPVYS